MRAGPDVCRTPLAAQGESSLHRSDVRLAQLRQSGSETDHALGGYKPRLRRDCPHLLAGEPFWKDEGFTIENILESGGKVVVFGRFTYRFVTLGKVVTSPFSIFARVQGEPSPTCRS